MNYIIAAGIFQIIVSLILLSLNHRKDKADYLLASLLVAIGWHLFTKFYIFTSFNHPSVSYRMHTFIQLAYGPLLYLYTKKICNEQFRPSRLWFLFVPLIISATLYSCVVAAFFSYPERADFVLSIYNRLVFLPIVITYLIFGILTILHVRNVKIPEQQLIRNLAFLIIIIGVTDAVLRIVSNNPSYTLVVRCVSYTLLGLVPVFIIRYKYVSGLSEWMPDKTNLGLQLDGIDGVFFEEKDSAQSLAQIPPVDVKRKFLLDSSQQEEVYEVIESYVKDKELFKDEDISLEKLSALSGYSRHYISETLNVFAQKSFYQYINEYRVKEVIRLLSDKKKEDKQMLSIAFCSGFKSKASFNQNFKKLTGKTPSEYLKSAAQA